MRVMFVGGGTGGHFYPLMAVAEAFTKSEKPAELFYIGPEKYNPESLSKNNVQYLWCPAGKRRRYFSLLNYLDVFKTFAGCFVAVYQLFVHYPDVLISKGSYTSVPVIFAAWLLRIPIIIHESDAVPGSANTFAKRFARYIAIAYDDAAEHFPPDKTALVGIPIRSALLTPVEGDPRTLLEITDERPIVLVLGGSQGAERVNTLIIESLDDLLPDYTVIHQTGPTSYDAIVASAQTLVRDETLLQQYRPVPFLKAETLHIAMSAADIIVARAGSTTIHEIAVHGKPSVLIPIPEEISHDQRTNAYAYARTGAATVMEEENLRDGLLAAELRRIMSDRTMYEQIATEARTFAIPDAAEKLAEIARQIGNEHE